MPEENGHDVLVRLRPKEASTTLEDYITYFEKVVEANGWSDETSANIFPSLLEVGNHHLDDIGENDLKKFTTIKAVLEKAQEPLREAFCQKLLNLKKEPTQSKEAYKRQCLPESDQNAKSGFVELAEIMTGADCAADVLPETPHSVRTRVTLPGIQKVVDEYKARGLFSENEVKPADAMISTLISNNASIFARHLAESGLRDQLEQDGAFTVFAPNDQTTSSLQTMRTISVSQLQQISGARKPTEVPFLLYHLAPTRIKLEDSAVIKTSLADRTLRINRQRHEVLTVNCVPLERTYVMVKEGVMHLLSKPLDPSPTFNLMDTILGDERLQTFATLIVQAQLAGDFRDDGPFTIFAPTQDTFSSLPGNFFESILYNTDAIKGGRRL
ncbi:unnamed protein product, partial [Cyprideis torosa]